MAQLHIKKASHAMSIQDFGRQGYRAQGLAKGGAVDIQALYEGAALVGNDSSLASIEMIAMGGWFQVTEERHFAVTGACAHIELDGQILQNNICYLLEAGQILKIGQIQKGTFAYLHISGGIDTPFVLGARSTNKVSQIGGYLSHGDVLQLGDHSASENLFMTLPIAQNEIELKLDILPSFQQELFSKAQMDRLLNAEFRIDTTKLDRRGFALRSDVALNLASDVDVLASDAIELGDIQILGDGTPYVFLSERQTMGGYPRIAQIAPYEIPRLVRAENGTKIQFQMIDLTNAQEKMQNWLLRMNELHRELKPSVRDPKTIHNLLSYQLISGAITGFEEEFI